MDNLVSLAEKLSTNVTESHALIESLKECIRQMEETDKMIEKTLREIALTLLAPIS